jgi:acetyl esterase
MDPRPGLDPQVIALFEMMRAGRRDRVLEAQALRKGLAPMIPLLKAGAPESVREEEIRIPGPRGEIRALLCRPPSPRASLPVLVYLHGGGWVVMSPETHSRLTRELSLRAGALVLSVDYRLAPEHPFPAPLEDCVAAYRWARARAASFGGDPSRVALGGDSAGGNLSAAATLHLLASGEAPPRALVMLCPVTDAALDTESYRLFAPDDPVLDAAIMEFFRDSYAARELWSDPLVSPLRADLSRFPPTCVVVAEYDPLADDGRAFAESLRRAGRRMLLLEYARMPHVFMLLLPGTDAGRRCIEETSEFLRGALA